MPSNHHAPGLILAAPRSGSGKTLIALGILEALKHRGLAVAAAKAGPDYIDATILSRSTISLDPWAMAPDRLRHLATRHATGADLLLVEGVMGLFDGAADGTGSTADLAVTLGLPVILVVDTERQSQSIAALVFGFVNFRRDIKVVGVILNRVASDRHEQMLRAALAPLGQPVIGSIRRDPDLHLPARHLGLVLPQEAEGFAQVKKAAGAVAAQLDLDLLIQSARQISPPVAAPPTLPPLGQHTAIASDSCFAFVYAHLLNDWRECGATLSMFSPLADEAPARDADAIFLPGGYPELHAAKLAGASRFKAGLAQAAERGALIYGECGGYMMLGEALIGADGTSHAMAGLLPVTTDFSRPKRRLGYRRLVNSGALPWPEHLRGHEFHYSGEAASRAEAPLFTAQSADSVELGPMGAVAGRVMGSYAHVIDASPSAGDV